MDTASPDVAASVEVSCDGALEVDDAAIRVSAETSHRLATRCDAHHIDHWMNGGPTCLDNLVLLCRRHHRVVHEGGFTLRWRPDHTIAFFDPSGTELRVAPPQPRIDIGHPLAPTTARLAAQGIVITPRTLPTWEGGVFNLGYAVDVLYVPSATLQRTPS